MPTPEQTIKKEIKRYVESVGGFWSAVQGGPYSKPGDPDIICCIDGRFVGIEAKTPTGRLSPMQITRGQEIEKAGGIFIVARSVDDVIQEFRGRGIVQDRGGSALEEPSVRVCGDVDCLLLDLSGGSRRIP